ncbi:sensor histidine kinase [Xanthocytophaga flava]|uniref:sensor histidine kinase n=1 Tax=Xanthocytophaga flava TaxID=3048013 RepID=UPI0028D24B28|nr:histidine kinase [Xanthocytophaga flavus]MDJ1470109.1 histidine kinase [Xanthocytophaga flavus]
MVKNILDIDGILIIFTRLKLLFMSRSITSLPLHWIQIIAWILFYCISVLYLLPQDPIHTALINPLVSISFYIVIIYGNAYLLIPWLYEKQKPGYYALALFIFFVAVVSLRVFLYQELYFKIWKESFFQYTFAHIAYAAFSTFLTLCISIIFKIALNYFALRKVQEELKAKQYQTELNLLKSQIQPHFLFNTLNNIYYEAYKESPKTAYLIEKLSEVMRYFIDDCPQDLVPISREMQFIHHYIELEKIRMRYPIQITINSSVSTDYLLPPMLLMPFVENVFKHGINKKNDTNEVVIELIEKEQTLHFTVRNTLLKETTLSSEGGFGLRNLKDRLELIFPNRFTLSAKVSDDYFIASLSIPKP